MKLLKTTKVPLLLLLLCCVALLVLGCSDNPKPPDANDPDNQTEGDNPVMYTQELGPKPEPAEKLKVALVQFAFLTGDVPGNVAQMATLIDDAALQGAQLIVLPELWSIGYGLDDPAALGESSVDGPSITLMKEKAKEHGVYICGGYPELANDGSAYDSAALFDPKGELILNHRKVMLYTPLGEDLVWAAGDKFEVVDTDFGRVGILICYDGDFPEPWRILAANKDADLIIHPTAYETPCEDAGWWDKLYEAGAMQNACWLVSANMAGQTPTGSNFFGGSRVIDPMGNTLESAPFVKPEETAVNHVLIVELDFAQGLADGNEHNGSIVTDRRVDVYRANGL